LNRIKSTSSWSKLFFRLACSDLSIAQPMLREFLTQE
jgi:hypothetical protein